MSDWKGREAAGQGHVVRSLFTCYCIRFCDTFEWRHRGGKDEHSSHIMQYTHLLQDTDVWFGR